MRSDCTKVEEQDESKLILFAETGSSTRIGPDINEIKKVNRRLFAKCEISSKFSYWYIFEDKNDADDLQSSCYYGGAVTIKWYYLD